MFKIISDLSLLLRKDLDVSDASNDVLASGVSGTWVTYNGAYLKRTTAATKLAWPVWNESNRNGTVGWTPDVMNSKKVSVLVGKYFATTDQFSGSPTVGASLDVAANGVLAAGSTAPVAYCTKAPYNVSYFGRTVSCIDIYVF